MTPDLETALADHRAAVAALSAASEQSGDRWLAPPSPGKWSPSQVVEHVARALEESGHVAAGRPSKFPSIFGRVTVADYARFQACHTRHHLKQMPS